MYLIYGFLHSCTPQPLLSQHTLYDFTNYDLIKMQCSSNFVLHTGLTDYLLVLKTQRKDRKFVMSNKRF